MQQTTLIRERFLADARRHLLANESASEPCRCSDANACAPRCSIEATMALGSQAE